MSDPHSSNINLTALERLKHWTDTTQLTAPMREHHSIPFLYQFSLNTLKDGLVHVLAVHRALEKEHAGLFTIRQNQYSSPKYEYSFRFVEHLASLGTPGLTADPDLWMAEQCMSSGAAATFHIRGFSAGAGSEGWWKTGEMLRHSIEVLTRLNCIMRESCEAFRWAIGVAQGDVEDERMVEWWQKREVR